MKSIFPILLVILTSTKLVAQNFELYPPELPFEAIVYGSNVFADIDGDNDEDLLVTGSDNAGRGVTELYKNDGTGKFEKVKGLNLIPLKFSNAAFADIDGDQDLDLFIMGDLLDWSPVSRLYLNDGSGVFTEVTGTNIVALKSGDLKFADVDGDQDQDLLICGLDDSNGNVYYTKLYKNDGFGAFTETIVPSLPNVGNGGIAFADVDGDQDQDLLLSGWSSLGFNLASLFLNDGTGDFTLKSNTPFVGMQYSESVFADVDGDQDLDLIQMGTGIAGAVTKLFRNDGVGNFTEVIPNPFPATYLGSVRFADVDGDNDQDVLLTGLSNSSRITRLYRNDGAGNFSQVAGSILLAVAYGQGVFSDVDGDSDMDVLVSGAGAGSAYSRLYKNDGTGLFVEVMPWYFKGINQGDVAFADIDGDSDQDLVYQGTSIQSRIIKLFTNDGAGNFTEVTNHPFVPSEGGNLLFADVDGDNDQDLFMNGGTGGLNRIVKLFLNDGQGNFTEAQGTPFIATYLGEAAFSDVDNDMDLDILITGGAPNSTAIAQLYLNDGTGHFNAVFPDQFKVIVASALAFADVNGDQLKDVIITGGHASQYYATLYLNNGAGSFTEQPDVPFVGVVHGNVEFSDVDGDLDQDVLITGELMGIWGERIAKLYLNDGSGHFTEDLSNIFEGVNYSDAVFIDLNQDGDDDLIISGRNKDELTTIHWYSNDGTGKFNPILNHPFKNVSECSIKISDVDGDDDLDVFIAGFNSAKIPVANLYLNDGGNVSVKEDQTLVNNELRLYPNPNAEGRFYLEFNTARPQTAQIALLDLNGRTMFERAFQVVSGWNTLSCDYPKLSSGLYWVRIVEQRTVKYLPLMVE